MKNILLIIPYGSVGGMERLAVTFYDGYKRKGYNVKVIKIIGLTNDIISFGDDEYILSGKDFSEYSASNRILFYLKIPFLIRNYIKKNKIDYSIAFGDMANSFSAVTYTKEVKIASLHAVKSVEFKNLNGIAKFFKWSIENTYKNFHRVVAISHAIKNDLLDNLNYSFKNVETIYNPHNHELIGNNSKELLSAEEENIFQGKVILFLGRLSLQKSPWLLIKSFSLIKRKNPDARLVLVGDGDKEVESYLEKLIRGLNLKDSVYFLGRKSNPYKYLAKANCLALSSLYEGTPNVIVEAMVLNIPVITTNCTDGISEMMIQKNNVDKENFIITDAGLIIKTKFDNSDFQIPNDFQMNENDKKYAEGLNFILEDTNNKIIRGNEKSELLKKYNLNEVLNLYIK
ncbi:glycosyltransferase [Epilithonimonas sp. UC225_85]|uniref:glycosyltransferase n=1 Tax=Epilithonimonas sp. UC225_85 TaxID=3350167 RepID=UPI0036D223FD